MAANEVDEADGVVLLLVLPLVVAVLRVGTEVCECEEVVLLGPDEAVPLTVGTVVLEAAGERLEVEALLLALD